MQFTVYTGNVAAVDAEAVVVGLFGTALTQAARALDEAGAGFISALIEAGDVTGELGEVRVLYRQTGIRAPRVVLLGLGDQTAFAETDFINVLMSAAKAVKSTSIAICADQWMVGRDMMWAARTAACAMVQARIPMTTLKTESKSSDTLDYLLWCTSQMDAQQAQACLQCLSAGAIEARAASFSKKLADLPPNICTPEYLANAVSEAIKDAPKALKLKVLKKAQIKKSGMGGLLAVSSGSAVDPVFIELSYQGVDKSEAPVVLVGKGITFDAGGISLKPARGMDEMKYDMSGAAVVLSAVLAAAELGLRINVTALVPACENLPSSTALKPADIITSSNGKTVEVLNTDAEGRLILADALVRAGQLNPKVVIDVATLTGACIVALGNHYSGLFCRDPELTHMLLEAGKSSADPVWPMPLTQEYKKQLKTPFADVANIATPANAGACTAAAFLSYFAPECPWAHLDVAGTANTNGANRRSTARPLGLLMAYLRMVEKTLN